jgi:uncharacterized membrane protein
MDREEKLQAIWAACFIFSGITFALAFFFTGVSGAYAGILAALGYIILYIGLSMAFLIVFAGLKRVSMHLSDTMKHRHEEIKEIQKELKHKYLKKKLDESSYRNLMQKYESELTEIEVKLKELRKEK